MFWVADGTFLYFFALLSVPMKTGIMLWLAFAEGKELSPLHPLQDNQDGGGQSAGTIVFYVNDTKPRKGAPHRPNFLLKTPVF